MHRPRPWLACAALLAAAGPLRAGDGDPSEKSGGARWGAEYFPNVELVSHEGRTVRFFDDLVRGKVVVVNFIYTRCPDACPLETAKLAEVQDLLGARVGEDVFFYSISIDPEHDTPAVLEEYRERFQTGPGWLFLTGGAADIELLRRKLGLLARDGDPSLAEHALDLVIGNQATGQWLRRSPMENPYVLAEQIGRWLSNWKLPPAPGRDYAGAPKLRDLLPGEALFRTRCSACHGIGARDGLARSGPDLLGVTERRERAWLARWLAEPDAMLAERDPVASELFAAYRGVPMPNMRLGEGEVEALIGYMAEESRRAREERPSAPPPAEGAVPPCCQKERELVLGSPGAALTVDAPRAHEETPLASPAAAVARASPVPRTALALSLGLGLALGVLGAALGRPARPPSAA